MLQQMHVPVKYPDYPIPNFVAMQIFVCILIVLFFLLVRMRLSVEKPGGLQHLAEGVNTFIENQSEEIIGGHDYKTYTSYLVALGVFILISNLLGLVPGFEAPTAVPSVPLGCALVTWFFYHAHGIWKSGPGYIKHFLGPVWWLAPLMFVIEVCSHLARLLSLTVRLYANMFAGDMVTLIFFSLVPLAVPIVFMSLHIMVSVIQTYIFVLLATVYLGEATASEH